MASVLPSQGCQIPEHSSLLPMQSLGLQNSTPYPAQMFSITSSTWLLNSKYSKRLHRRGVENFSNNNYSLWLFLSPILLFYL